MSITGGTGSGSENVTATRTKALKQLSEASKQRIEQVFGSFINNTNHELHGVEVSKTIMCYLNESLMLQNKAVTDKFVDVLVTRYNKMPEAAMNFAENTYYGSYGMTATQAIRYMALIGSDRIANVLERYADTGSDTIHSFSWKLANRSADVAIGKSEKGLNATIKSLWDDKVLETVLKLKDSTSIYYASSIIADALGRDMRVVRKVCDIMIALDDLPKTLDNLNHHGDFVDHVEMDIQDKDKLASELRK